MSTLHIFSFIKNVINQEKKLIKNSIYKSVMAKTHSTFHNGTNTEKHRAITNRLTNPWPQSRKTH